ncbi:MAG: hypothetical protein A3I05_08780 [Deltaproteobacteria bacterium RIFCSPLOWO2_02_FULL_44_10]|nr:MAG: hypothetical protein A3C46_02310 [Deltaproteobacteria bacterium RIFCSPHIGHO2_02_FULL_44_16]OGQ45790.1 MAG: hypothetical protein A3I05_08780 [Deltaproteobacteria bacterium RIFCSPLOWO2_02_FULL_44_10]
MTEHEEKVWQFLKLHVGKQNAISYKHIAEATDLGERLVREIIRTLKLQHHKLIGLSLVQPSGYFVLSDLEEIKACSRISFAYEQSNRENRLYYEQVEKEIVDQQMSLL